MAGIRPGRALVVDRVRSARQDDRARAAAFELVVGRVEREQLRVDVELADATRDELGELAAEVEDDDGARRRGVGTGGTRLARAVVGGAALRAVSR